MKREEAQEMFDGMWARGEEHPQAAFDQMTDHTARLRRKGLRH